MFINVMIDHKHKLGKHLVEGERNSAHWPLHLLMVITAGTAKHDAVRSGCGRISDYYQKQKERRRERKKGKRTYLEQQSTTQCGVVVEG